MNYGIANTDQFELDIKGVLLQEPNGSYSLNRKEFFYEDPFIQALWVGYQLGLVRAKLQENNKEKKKVPALLKASDYEYNGTYR